MQGRKKQNEGKGGGEGGGTRSGWCSYAPMRGGRHQLLAVACRHTRSRHDKRQHDTIHDTTHNNMLDTMLDTTHDTIHDIMHNTDTIHNSISDIFDTPNGTLR